MTFSKITTFFLNLNTWILTTFLTFILLSCKEVRSPNNVQKVVEQAGDNKSELTDVIAYYSKHPSDSLKLKAAYFLIANMDGWYYYKGELLDHYQEYVKLIRRDKSHGAYFMKSLDKLYGPFSNERLEKRYDINEVKGEELISNIEAAFKVWREQPWGKDISFENFCEYILPFRVGNEIPEYNRDEIYRQFNGILDSVRKANGDAVAACIAINKELQKIPLIHTTRLSFMPYFSASTLIKHGGIGYCRDRTALALYVMRAVGIPVGIDFIPQWPWRSGGTTFNIMLDKHGKTIIFMGMEENPGEPHGLGRVRGKIYRKTYSKNPLSLAMQKHKEDVVPPFFQNPRLVDVTDKHVPCFNIPVSLNKIPVNNRFVYLSVFSNTEWVPIQWTRIKSNHANFISMEGGAVYLPSYFNKVITPANYPVILDIKGRVKYLIPDSSRLHTKMVIQYKQDPFFPDWFLTERLKRGRFQGANNPDFSDAVELFKISFNPSPSMTEVPINVNKKFRYFRYVAPPHKDCQMGEMEFYFFNTKLKGKIIGISSTFNDDPQFALDKAMDNDVNTGYISKSTSGAWVGLDVGKPVQVNKIRFSSEVRESAIQQVYINPEQIYELFYWDNKWVSAGTKHAKGSEVVFSNVPSNTLYILRGIVPLSDDINNRIFTYENGKQVWW